MSDLIVGDAAASIGSPSSDDNLYFEGGNTPIITNVDQSALANGLATIIAMAARTGDIGTAAAPLYTECSVKLICKMMAGTFYFRCKDTTDATPLIQIGGAGNFQFVTGGTATRFEIMSASAQIAGGCLATNVRASGGNLYIVNTGSSTAQTVLHLMAGPSGGASVLTERGITTGTVEAGTLRIDNDGTAITTLNLTGSAQVAKTIIEDSGTITTLNVYGHVPDMTRLSRPITITNTNINMSLPGSFDFLANPMITFTNAATKYITQ